MKKGLLSLVSAAAMLLGSCGLQPSVEGDDLINNAREEYRSLNSAKVIMTNADTNEVEQTFTFKYDEKDILTFSYEGKNGDDVYAQYNNGMESFTYEKGKYQYHQKGDDEFIAYTRDVTHPQAGEGLIIFQPSAVKNAEVKTEGEITHIFHEYDIENLSVDDSTTAFSADYYFDNQDKLLYFVESSTIITDGEEKEYKYRVDITEKNAVDKIENTVEQYKK